MLNLTSLVIDLEKMQIYELYKLILDGVNFDFEEELEVGSEESRAYTKILKETARVFHQRIPDSQVDKYKTIRIFFLFLIGKCRCCMVTR